MRINNVLFPGGLQLFFHQVKELIHSGLIVHKHSKLLTGLSTL